MNRLVKNRYESEVGRVSASPNKNSSRSFVRAGARSDCPEQADVVLVDGVLGGAHPRPQNTPRCSQGLSVLYLLVGYDLKRGCDLFHFPLCLFDFFLSFRVPAGILAFSFVDPSEFELESM